MRRRLPMLVPLSRNLVSFPSDIVRPAVAGVPPSAPGGRSLRGRVYGCDRGRVLTRRSLNPPAGRIEGNQLSVEPERRSFTIRRFDRKWSRITSMSGTTNAASHAASFFSHHVESALDSFSVSKRTRVFVFISHTK